ncbi:MAG: OmpA family protein [Nesterenkonia sp.]
MSRHITYVSAPSVVALVSAGALLMASAAPTAAADASVLPEPEGDIGDYGEFITSYDENEFISSYDPADFIESLGSAESEEEDVIVLETDILFAAMEWELPGPAGSKIGELVEEVPEGVAVEVNGHTDSNPVPEGHDFDNQVLSENRAEAVAEVLGDERPDLELSVEGFGEDQPAVEEDEEDPDTFAANRRVEIRYD